MPYKDVIKRQACAKRYYQRNKELYYLKNIRRKQELNEFVISLKQKPCMDCGVQYPHYVMDFDHRDSSVKFMTISLMAKTHHFSKENLLKEVAKCDLVCSNCHRIRTHCPVG